MQRRTFLKLAMMMTAHCAKSPSAQGPQRLGLASDRDGYFYAPPRHHNAPVVLYLHGATGSGERAIGRFTEYAERTGTIVVAPDSREYTWGLVTGDEKADLAFIDRALNKIFARCSVDAKRIAVAGFSDGASAALSWGLLDGERFCGIAAFSPGFIHLSAEPHGRPKVFISHGTQLDSVDRSLRPAHRRRAEERRIRRELSGVRRRAHGAAGDPRHRPHVAARVSSTTVTSSSICSPGIARTSAISASMSAARAAICSTRS